MVLNKYMKDFVKHNLKLLTSKYKNQIPEIKRKKNDFWRNLKKESIPSNQDIAKSTVIFLIKTKVISQQKDLDELIIVSDYINKYLVIKDLEIIFTDIFTENRANLTQTFLTRKDYKNIKREEYHQKQVLGKASHDYESCVLGTTYKEKVELLRRYGYDILINRFEPLLRTILINEVLIINYGLKNWQNEIPKGIINILVEEKDINFTTMNIEEFFEETYLWCLKEIAVFSDHYKFMECLTNGLSKKDFIEFMDILHEIRKKIAHAKSTFSATDLNDLIFNIRSICQGELGKELIEYIDREDYLSAEEIPSTFYDEYKCPNNLPSEDYDLVGGFIGRKKEITQVIKLLYSDQDRIITITGAGGIGKTAVALKTSYRILSDRNNPFEAILWFTAKEEKLTEHGIIPIESDIKSGEQLIKGILNIIDPKMLEVLERTNLAYDKYEEHVYSVLSTRKCLLIFDNLETIKDEEIIGFIKELPRPSKGLITSRKGLGEIERRYVLPDFSKNDAIKLFRVISNERNRKDLLKLSDIIVNDLVGRVKYYPLLIKWAIGRVCIGKDIYEAFSEIYSGKSDIAKFVFNDVFNSLKSDSKSCLFSMIIFGDKPIIRPFLMHLADLDDDTFDDVIQELIIVSFVYNENVKTERSVNTFYHMLSLTRGYVRYQLERNKTEFNSIQSRYRELLKQIDEYDKSQKIFYQALESIGITSDDEKISFKYVKTAKEYQKIDDIKNANKNFEEAIKISPNFPYALNEYAKFKENQGYFYDSDELFKRSISADPENWHTYYHYGLSLKNQNRITESIEALEKARKLNPKFIGIFNNLGRLLTWKGDFETANRILKEINELELYSRISDKLNKTYYQADNYKRWAESYFNRDDLEGGLDKLYKALNVIESEKEISNSDLRILKLEKQISLDIAIHLHKIGKFDDAFKYFKRSYRKLRLKSGIIVSSDEIRSKAYYFTAKYGFESGKISKEQINKYIKKGISITQKNYIHKFKNLAMIVNKLPEIPKSEKRSGYIKYFNFQKNYGIIYSEGDSFIFFKSDFYKFTSDETLLKLEGREVSFTLRDDPKKSGEKIATNIIFE